MCIRDSLGGHRDGLEGETPFGQRRQRVAFGQTGVDEPEPDMLDSESGGRCGHLVAAHLGDVALDVRVVLERLVEDVATLPAGPGHDADPGSGGDIHRRRPSPLARLVVRVLSLIHI